MRPAMQQARVRYQIAVSVDGLIGPEDGSIEWLKPFESVGTAIMTPFMKEIGGVLMGRATYEQYRALGEGSMDDLPTVVLSSSPEVEVPSGVELCTTGPRAALDLLRPRVNLGDIWLMGGGRAASGFMSEGLIDQIELTTVPVVLGTGIPLFAQCYDSRNLQLVSSRTGPLGTVTSIYARR